MTPPTPVRATRPIPAVAAPLGFLGAYLAASPIHDALADRPLPLPTATAADTAAYYAANPLAVAMLAALQVVSVACFVVFVAVIAPLLRDTGSAGARLPLVGYLSAAAMVVSGALAGTAAAVARSGSADLVDVLRKASFYAGGVANVVLLGVVVFGAALLLGRRGLLGKPTRVFGYVAGTLAMLSALSLGIYYATTLLPIGRVLCMLWTVIAGIRLARAHTPD